MANRRLANLGHRGVQRGRVFEDLTVGIGREKKRELVGSFGSAAALSLPCLAETETVAAPGAPANVAVN